MFCPMISWKGNFIAYGWRDVMDVYWNVSIATFIEQIVQIIKTFIEH